MYSPQSSTTFDDIEDEEDLDYDLDAGDDGMPGVDGSLADEFDDFDAILDKQEREAERELERAIKDLENPEAPRIATGPELWLGFDGEWFRSSEDENTILTIQLYVPPQQPCFRMPAHDESPEAYARKLGRLSCMIRAEGPGRHQRPELSRALQRIVAKAIELGLIAEEPAVVVVVGFGLRFDLAALRDFQELKREVDVVAGRVATVNADAELSINWRQHVRAASPSSPGERHVPSGISLTSGDGLGVVRMKVRFIDAAAYVPVGTSLRWVGKLVGREKLDIPAPHSIEAMDQFLLKNPAAFESYAMRDAEIAALFGLRIRDFAQQRLGLGSLSPTASGLALKWFMKTLPEEARLSAFGLQRVRREAWHQASRKRQTFTQVEPTPMRSLQDPLTTLCFKGGRNEAYWLGPTDPALGAIWDYDLAGAYTHALLDLKRIDFEHPRFSTAIEDYLGHVAGYVLLEYEHLPDTRFPVFAVDAGGKGLIFPGRGVAYATAPEILAAHGVGCKMTIRWGVIYPWLDTPSASGEGEEEDPTQRPFFAFVKGVREMRKQLKDEEKARAEEAGEEPRSDLIEEQFVKLLGNSLTGKCSQGLRPKNVYDSRGARSVQLRPSAITNPPIAAYVTSYIRALLTEILNKIPRRHVIVSATTDGFLTSAPREDIDLTGPLSRRFQRLCWWVIPGSEMLEVKHAAAQVVCMKTRGQLTSLPLPGQKIVVAKAGVQPTVRITSKMTSEEIRRAQNDELLRMYLDRTPESMVSLRSFPSLRDQWEKGVDLVKAERHIRMSLEFDLKRKLVDARELPVLGWNATHVAADTVPWDTVEEFERARARLDQFRSPPKPPAEEGSSAAAKARRKRAQREARCLKTVADVLDLDGAIHLGRARDQVRADGLPVLNMGRDGPEGMLKRAFLRVYTRGELGLVRKYTYSGMAQWLTDHGLAATTQEVKTAKQQPVVLSCVPRTPAVLRLLQELQAVFPEADMHALLVPSADEADELGDAGGPEVG